MSKVHPFATLQPDSALQAFRRLGLQSPGDSAADLPFGPGDVTAGSETELQAAVVGTHRHVDLPITIEQSSYFRNVSRRADVGEMPRRAVRDLDDYVRANPDGVWENSWVRFPAARLSGGARAVLEEDLLRDRTQPALGPRTDRDRFLFSHTGEAWVRVPISYLLKLALAQFLTDGGKRREDAAGGAAWRLLDHFLNDNTSPETTSLYVCGADATGRAGGALARETALRFLLTQLLLVYANQAFGLEQLGQRAIAYLSPLPPTRQLELNDCISDAFYREMFMSPCLSGWDRGEEKHEYMGLCHQVLSRSQLNTLKKLKEAGILVHNLVVLPNVSNTSLANNGTHISVGSRRLTALLRGNSDPAAAAAEKHLGDLITKVVEHFLPLFVGTYTAAPHRIPFVDFHPERVLGFLPHELHYSHLRMIWRRWKGKADIRLFGRAITPFGPRWADELIGRVFGLKGDYVPDLRLVDYLVCLLSTEQSPALDGTWGNWERLKRDLESLGVFDRRLATYLLFRQRQCAVAGYAGFEGRYYSVFENFQGDLADAADLQQLVTLAAFQLVGSRRLDHADIPDTPRAESERRQAIFGAAIGIPTFFVQKETGNTLLKAIFQRVVRIRSSRRYPGTLRVVNADYRLALLDYLEQETPQAVEALDMRATLDRLRRRLAGHPGASAEERLCTEILRDTRKRSPLDMEAKEFNREAERYYRGRLRRRHIREGLAVLNGGGSRVRLPGSASVDELADRILCDTCALADITKLLDDLLQFIHQTPDRHDPTDDRHSAPAETPVRAACHR